MAGIYIHIPFCKQACHYCDFHFSTSLQTKEPLLRALQHEIASRKDYLNGEPIHTIYFGGGTPSLLQKAEIDAIFEALSAHFDLSAVQEITLEANPDDLSAAKLAELHSTPINRLSIGIQSFRDQDLTFLHRSHSAADALRCIQQAADIGFEQLSIDLIYGIPNMSMDDWRNNIQQALSLPITHLSAYSLTIEEKTVFGNWYKKGQLHVVDEDEVAAQFMTLLEMTSGEGFEQYEISNFSKAGSEAVHNGNYWRGAPYLGLGPAAHSYNGVSRRWNVANNAIYLKHPHESCEWFEEEVLTKDAQYNEYLLTSLRTRWGCDVVHVKEKWGIDLTLHTEWEDLQNDGFITVSGPVMTLTTKGKLLADSITEKFII